MPTKRSASSVAGFLSGGARLALAASAMVLLAAPADAASLGPLTVLSALGQPLQAEIALSALSREEASQVEVGLASREDFQRANVALTPALLGLRFHLEHRGGRDIVVVRSEQPLNEPYVNLLLELNAPGGRMVREYTFLLDPADLQPRQPVQTAPPRQPLLLQQERQPSSPSAAQAGQQPARPGNGTVRQEREGRAKAAPAAPAQPQRYQVKRGDTLARIARQTGQPDISLDQMLVALQRANPDAFAEGNMNRLHSGRILNIPSPQEAREVAPAEARRIVRAQTADFNRYRSQLAAQARTVRAAQAPAASQSASGAITSEVSETPTAQNEARDRLELSRASGTPDDASRNAEAISRQKALAEANARVEELEKNLAELQALLEIKNQALAQQQAAAAPAPVPEAAPEAETASTTGDEPSPAQAEQLAAATAAPPAPAAAPEQAPPEPGMVEKLLQSPALPGILAAILAALIGAGILGSRRRKRQQALQEDAAAEPTLLAAASSLPAAPEARETAEMAQEEDGAPGSGVAEEEAGGEGEAVLADEADALAAAEMYLALGQHEAAEAVLQAALRERPDDHAMRVRLLALYADRHDQEAFAAMAGELYSRTAGQGVEWRQAAALGVALEPDNPLYADALPAEEGGAPLAEAAPPVSGLALEMPDEEEEASAGWPSTGLAADDLSLAVPAAGDEDGFAAAAAGTPGQDEPDAGLDFALPDEAALEDVAPAAAFPAEQEADAPGEPSEPKGGLDLDFDFAGFEHSMRQALHSAEQGASESPPAESGAQGRDLLPEDEQVPSSAASSTDTGEERLAQSAEAGGEAPEPLDFDLSGISLELNPLEASEAEEGFGFQEEYATKLELALACQEIGDAEGARELLEEVVRGGNPDQVDKAQALLESLD